MAESIRMQVMSRMVARAIGVSSRPDLRRQGKGAIVALSPTWFPWSGTIVEFSPTSDGAVYMVIRYVEADDSGPRRK
jgi:hypothetical protein